MKVSQLHRPRTHAGPGCRPKVAKLLDVELAEHGLLSLVIHPGHAREHPNISSVPTIMLFLERLWRFVTGHRSKLTWGATRHR